MPTILPVFPLTGSLLLPGGVLPLHIFEPRYCAMIEDALEADRTIGMVQPRVPDPDDNRGPAQAAEDRAGEGAGLVGSTGEPSDPGSDGEERISEEIDTRLPDGSGAVIPELYGVGCAGRIEEYQVLPYGRYVIVLRGLGRFAIRDEIESHRGYRRVVADYGPYAIDRADRNAKIAAGGLLEDLGNFASKRDIEIDLEQLQGMSGLALLNGLAMNLPFRPAEKQALLEAETVEARREVLSTLLVMGIEDDTELTH